MTVWSSSREMTEAERTGRVLLIIQMLLWEQM